MRFKKPCVAMSELVKIKWLGFLIFWIIISFRQERTFNEEYAAYACVECQKIGRANDLVYLIKRAICDFNLFFKIQLSSFLYYLLKVCSSQTKNWTQYQVWILSIDFLKASFGKKENALMENFFREFLMISISKFWFIRLFIRKNIMKYKKAILYIAYFTDLGYV